MVASRYMRMHRFLDLQCSFHLRSSEQDEKESALLTMLFRKESQCWADIVKFCR
jgi:hypothetical protein